MSEYSALIIDDDVWMQRILSKTLQSYGFKKIVLASNGFEGIDLAIEHRPTVIVLDILMPELSGHLTLKVLKAIRHTKNVPVLMVSALSDVENLGMAVKAGIAGYISKPFTRATVLEKLIDVFGQEKLDLISKGIPMSEENLYINDTNFAPERVYDSANDFAPINVKPEDSPVPSQERDENSKHAESLLRHYQDDEKKSIESIKKLLLKSKK